MLVQTISSVILTLLLLWFAWSELGVIVFYNPITYVLLALWFYISIISLSLRWEEAKHKTTDDKIDDLITTINIQIQKTNELNNLMRRNWDEPGNNCKD